MATPVNMPQVGQDLESARIIEWHVKEGDLVKESDIIATVESDKASFEVEALAEGTILKLLFDEGEDGYVFKPIAYIGEPGESIPGQEEVESLPELNEDDFEPEAKDIFIEEIKNEGKIF
ncbi:MAG: biotin/lipoyl-containing protein, partial [Bacteroidales bacterium]